MSASDTSMFAMQLGRREHEHDDLAVFGGAEQHFAIVIIFGEDIGRRRRYVAGVRLVEQDVFDRALLILVAVDGLGQCLWAASPRR